MSEEQYKTLKLPRIKNPLKSIPKVCSWCGSLYSIEDWNIPDDKKTGVTHGICLTCFAKMQKDINNKK